MAKREQASNNNSGKVSISAWQATINDINERFDKIESRINEAVDKLNTKVSTSAWQNSLNDNSKIEEKLKELNEKLSSKVSINAWQKSLEESGKSNDNLTVNQLQEIDARLEKAMQLVTGLTTHLNEKVNVTAWNKLCQDNEGMLNRLNDVETVIKNASLSEQEIKKLLETI